MAELSMATFTDTVIGAIGPGATPRVRTVMTALIRHLHDFAREVKLTTPEYRAACDFIVRIGRMSDDKRNEAVLASDVFGLESLVDVLDHHNAERGAATDSAVLDLGNGTRLAFSTDTYVISPLFFPGGDIGSLAVHGTVNDLAMAGAVPLALIPPLAFAAAPQFRAAGIRPETFRGSKKFNKEMVEGVLEIVKLPLAVAERIGRFVNSPSE